MYQIKNAPKEGPIRRVRRIKRVATNDLCSWQSPVWNVWAVTEAASCPGAGGTVFARLHARSCCQAGRGQTERLGGNRKEVD